MLHYPARSPVVDSFSVIISDPEGATATSTVTVTVEGANDSPQITTTVQEASGSLVEDAGSSIGGTLSALDVDQNDQLTWSGSSQGAFGSFTISPSGVWSYDVTPDAIDGLNAGQVEIETFVATVTDQSAASDAIAVSITLTGTNDAPVLVSSTADARGAVTEGDEINTVSGALQATDVDTSDSVSWTGVPSALFGTFSLTSIGAWSYTLDNALADQLSEGEVVTETLAATAADPQGGTVTQTVEVTVTGTNDRPIVSINTDFETLQETTVSGSLLASDIDTIDDALTFALGDLEPQNGIVTVNADGTFAYTPNSDFVGIERFSYTVTDDFGAQSSGRVTIAVESDGDDPANANVSIGLNVDATAEAAAGSVEIGVETTVPTPVNLAIALDRSGSIGFRDWRTLLESTQDAVETLTSQFAGSDTEVDVKIITFASNVSVSRSYTLGEQALIDDLNPSVFGYSGGATRWDLALEEAGNFFFTEGEGEANFLLFITDGIPTNGLFTVPLAALQDPNDNYDVTINAFGFGDDFVDGSLDQIDPGARLLNSADELANALQTTPIFNPELTFLRVTLQADGGDEVEIADALSPNLIVEGTDFELPLASIENILGLLGESNRINIDARFDLNNDPATSEINLFSSDLIGKASTAQIKSGLDAADLIFGSDLADSLSGAGGDDILIAFDGDDTLDGGAGEDTLRGGDGDDTLIVSQGNTSGDNIDGGAGRDVLALQAIGDINAMLADLTLNDIEALDLANGNSDALGLAYSDILSISDNLDSELAGLSGVDGARTMSIYGESQDTVQLDAQNLYQVVNTGTAQDSDGVDLVLFQFQDNLGNALATLGVQSDVGVEIANVPVG